jgi:hypothetical protein
MGITAVERIIKLRQEKLVIADHSANTQQCIAQRRTVAFALNFRMLREQLAKKCRAGSREPGYSDKIV